MLNVNLTVFFGNVIGITWPIPAEINDATLEKQPLTPPGFYEGPKRGRVGQVMLGTTHGL